MRLLLFAFISTCLANNAAINAEADAKKRQPCNVNTTSWILNSTNQTVYNGTYLANPCTDTIPWCSDALNCILGLLIILGIIGGLILWCCCACIYGCCVSSFNKRPQLELRNVIVV
jgi:hypothetical protein